jgi:hypothetical protein
MRVKIPLAALGAAVAIAAGGCLGGGGAVNPPASSAVGPAESAAKNPGGGLVIHGEPGNPCDRLLSAAEANQASGLTGFVTPNGLHHKPPVFPQLQLLRPHRPSA